MRIYDNGGATLDRYTFLPPRDAWREHRDARGLWNAVASCKTGRAFFQHTSAMPGRHLGKRVAWDSLPESVRACVRDSALSEFCP